MVEAFVAHRADRADRKSRLFGLAAAAEEQVGIGLTAGASTPDRSIDEVEARLAALTGAR